MPNLGISNDTQGNSSGILYPNIWDVPGGHLEKLENPEKCIVREMKEEMNLTLDEFELFSKIEFDDMFTPVV